MNKLKIVFLGTPEFSLPCLELLSNHPVVDLNLVISMPDRPKGRGHELASPAVIEFCKTNKLPYHQCENINKDLQLIESLKKQNIDLVIVIAFAQFLSSTWLNLPKLGCFNIHTSILPKYRGAAPIQHALLNGDQKTGVSIQKMVKQMDAGPLVHFLEVPIFSYETHSLLYTRLKNLASIALSDLLDKFINKTITYVEQNSTNISFAPEIKKDDGLISFSKLSVEQINNRFRAYSPWPGIYCQLDEKRLKILQIDLETKKIRPGELETSHGMLLIGALDGTLRLTNVQYEGKKAMLDTEFLRGYKGALKLNSN